MKSYSELLKDKRWIQLSEQTKEFYNYSCIGCGSNDNLNTHHLKYTYNRKPWEYNMDELTVLCKDCHSLFHANKAKFNEVMTDGRLFYSYECDSILDVIKAMCTIETNDYSKVLEFVKSLQIETF